MSGHSRWSQIKHQKAITDKKRAQIFSKISRLITLAARKGADPKLNQSLAQTIERAHGENMPNENIERAIKRVSEKSAGGLDTLSIEAIGPGGTALKITAITDNRNRTIAEIRKIIENNESKMVRPESINWMFDQPEIKLGSENQVKLEKLLEALDDNDDVENIETNTK